MTRLRENKALVVDIRHAAFACRSGPDSEKCALNRQLPSVARSANFVLEAIFAAVSDAALDAFRGPPSPQ